MSVLAVDDLRLKRGEREILRGVNARVEESELVALMGLSGGGKTTVLRCIAAIASSIAFLSSGSSLRMPMMYVPRATSSGRHSSVGCSSVQP